ncbi:MAG: zf-HC2 domain-containing protein [Acidimicrobiales bacterium]
MNEEWLSAYLDDELAPAERDELEAAIAADPALAATHAELTDVRSRLRGASVTMPDAALGRVLAAVGSDDAGAPAAVLAFPTRRRTPTFAAAAAVFVIIAGVVGGLGGATRIPALGDLVARHEVAAAVIDGAEMPDDMGHMDKMPMDDAAAAALVMPADYSMADAFLDGSTVHLVYRTAHGDPVSVIRQDGEADLDALGDGAMMSDDGVEMWTAPMGDAYVAVVDGSGYYWTVISTEPPDDMMDVMVHDLPSRSPSMGERLRAAADAVVDPFRL